jgi:hypothetical protein
MKLLNPQAIGTAGGDLSGAYPDPEVVAIHSGPTQIPISSSFTDGELVIYQGGELRTTSLNPTLVDTVTALEDITKGDLVTWSGTADRVYQSQSDDNARSRAFAIAIEDIATGASGQVVRRGRAAGVLIGATPGATYYLGASGGLQTAMPVNGDRVIVAGYAQNTTDLEVIIHELPLTHRVRYGVEPSGVKNGVNTVFTLPEIVVISALRVYFNGKRLHEGAVHDYTTSESGGAGTGYDTITLANPPLSFDHVLCDYATASTL